jgi:hypothetical protein
MGVFIRVYPTFGIDPRIISMAMNTWARYEFESMSWNGLPDFQTKARRFLEVIFGILWPHQLDS